MVAIIDGATESVQVLASREEIMSFTPFQRDRLPAYAGAWVPDADTPTELI